MTWLRLGEKGRPTLYTSYDPDFGRVGWTDVRGRAWRLVAAVVGGVDYEP